MITTTKTQRICYVAGANQQQIEDDLNAAVELIRQEAMKEGLHGILVTRYAPTAFTVAVSSDVPYGTTMESCKMHMGDVPGSRLDGSRVRDRRGTTST